jgi:hypothetical protein
MRLSRLLVLPFGLWASLDTRVDDYGSFSQRIDEIPQLHAYHFRLVVPRDGQTWLQPV